MTLIRISRKVGCDEAEVSWAKARDLRKGGERERRLELRLSDAKVAGSSRTPFKDWYITCGSDKRKGLPMADHLEPQSSSDLKYPLCASSDQNRAELCNCYCMENAHITLEY